MISWKKKKKRSSKIILPLILLITISFVGLTWMLIKTKTLLIKTVDLTLQKIECVNEQQIRNSTNIAGQNFFLINKNFIEKNLKEKFICIKRINLDKFFPSKIKLEIFGREAVALLVNLKDEATESASLENIATPSAQTSDSRYLTDDGGLVFGKASEQSNLSVIYLYDPNLSLGKKIDLDVLRILEKTKTFGLNVVSVRVINNSLIIYPNESPKIFFKLGDNIETQIASLQLILEKAKIDSSQLEFIDLRFDKPIVRIVPKKNG